MKHNLHGDIPKADLELAKELLEMEHHFETNQSLYEPATVAKVFLCLAHDFYDIGDDDKGSELLENANKICPGYFDNQIKDHIEQDPDFARVVESLTHQILVIARSLVE